MKGDPSVHSNRRHAEPHTLVFLVSGRAGFAFVRGVTRHPAGESLTRCRPGASRFSPKKKAAFFLSCGRTQDAVGGARTTESFYGSPPQLFFNDFAGFQTNNVTPEKGAHRPPDVIVWPCFANKKICYAFVFHSILPSCRAAMKRPLKNRCFLGRLYGRINLR